MTNDDAGARPGAPQSLAPARDAIVVAAQQMVIEMFNLASAQLPDLLKLQDPAAGQVAKFSDEMINQLKGQVERALGLPAAGKDKTS
ncbi:MAG: hypothetical protein VX661_09920 [Pseudomonadota bacterium]|nr:hypothetical protein [Pseudomonadota bacterium]